MKFPDLEKPLPDALELIAYKIARATQEFWMLDMTRKGWRPALKTDQEKKEHAWLMGWHRLPKEIQQQYIVQARAMPWIIWRAGLELILDAKNAIMIFREMIKSERSNHGTNDRRPGRTSTTPKHRAGREQTLKQKKQGPPGEGSGKSGNTAAKDPSDKAGGSSGSDREGAEDSPE